LLTGQYETRTSKKISTDPKLNIPKAEIGGAEEIVSGNALHEAEGSGGSGYREILLTFVSKWNAATRSRAGIGW
jgi:hypothetical protein